MFPAHLRPWRDLARKPSAAERLDVRTRDGFTLALWRVRPTGAAQGAVLLLHGLAANRFAFHWPGRSVASYLAREGFDVFVGELRGAGGSTVPTLTFSLHDFLELDVPALLEATRAASGEARVHFIGHSMGGILMMCHAIHSQGEGLASGVALGSALDYRAGGSGFEPVLKLRPLLRRLGHLPWGAAMRLVAPALARVRDPLSGFNFHPGHTEAQLVRAVYSNVFGSIPTALLGSLATAFEVGGIRSRSGEAFLAQAARLRTPLLLVAAGEDRQCPLAALEATAQATGARVLRFGARFGHRADYGHFDLLLGRHAPDEVWPALAQWLKAPSPR